VIQWLNSELEKRTDENWESEQKNKEQSKKGLAKRDKEKNR